MAKLYPFQGWFNFLREVLLSSSFFSQLPLLTEVVLKDQTF